MLPASFEIPFAVLLVLGGTLACFAGYRLFRLVLGIYGFILGAMIGSSMMASSNAMGMIVAGLVGGVAGALILVFAYFIGIALVGAGIGALIANVAWTQVRVGEVPWQLAVGAAVVGAFTAMLLQRYVIIVGTAFSGSWTLIVGALTAAGDRALARAASATEAWVFYPISPAPGQRWVSFAWVAVGLIGTGVQLTLTSKKK
ncbi:MAG TPA: DUF4203 domain-containing protein [Vicinamibacterales bacterium]|jgi:hypothetical protein|nr:DUF4203 domain-containing protein [Vicinamibacterales bacterium]